MNKTQITALGRRILSELQQEKNNLIDKKVEELRKQYSGTIDSHIYNVTTFEIPYFLEEGFHIDIKFVKNSFRFYNYTEEKKNMFVKNIRNFETQEYQILANQELDIKLPELQIIVDDIILSTIGDETINIDNLIQTFKNKYINPNV